MDILLTIIKWYSFGFILAIMFVNIVTSVTDEKIDKRMQNFKSFLLMLPIILYIILTMI